MFPERSIVQQQKKLCESILLFVLHQKINSQTYHDFTERNSRNTLQLKILPENITKETFMGKHVKGIMYFSFCFSLKIYCQTVQRQNARLSQLQTRCFREAYTGLPVVRVTENKKALNCVVLNYSIPVSEE